MTPIRKEIGLGSRNPRLDKFITEEFDQAGELTKIIQAEKMHLSPKADALFRDILEMVS